MKQKIYFGHPRNTYGTELEQKLLAIISQCFPEFDIENPGQNLKHRVNQIRLWKKITGNGMNYFFFEILPKCHAGIFLPFRDDKWGAGIVGEAEFLIKKRFLVWQIDFNGIISKIGLDEIKTKALSVEETRVRIRDASGKSIPY